MDDDREITFERIDPHRVKVIVLNGRIRSEVIVRVATKGKYKPFVHPELEKEEVPAVS